jgi:hypothetical protein
VKDLAPHGLKLIPLTHPLIVSAPTGAFCSLPGQRRLPSRLFTVSDKATFKRKSCRLLADVRHSIFVVYCVRALHCPHR